jgi:pyridoxine/pyridoxamine 5'-phosphate oxidase
MAWRQCVCVFCVSIVFTLSYNTNANDFAFSSSNDSRKSRQITKRPFVVSLLAWWKTTMTKKAKFTSTVSTLQNGRTTSSTST